MIDSCIIIICVTICILISDIFYRIGKNKGYEAGKNATFVIIRNLILYDSERFIRVIKTNYPEGLTYPEHVAACAIMLELENAHGIKESEETDKSN